MLLYRTNGLGGRIHRRDIRVLFAFDPHRAAILLIGGDKSGEWSTWYDRVVPVADNLFDEHLRELESEGAPYAQDP